MTTIAALHQQGSFWRLAIVTTSAAAAPSIERLSFPLADLASLREALRSRAAARLLHVLPASACVCRVVQLPDGPSAPLLEAAALLAEAELPSTIPAHRRAACVLATGPQPGTRWAVLLGWAGAAPAFPFPELEHTCTAEPVALLHMAVSGSAGAVANGTGPVLAAYADPSTSCFSIASLAPGQLTLRSRRETQPAEASIRAAFAAESPHAPASALITLPHGCCLGSTSRDAAITATSLEHAIATAAALAATSSLAPLCALRVAAPRSAEPRALRAARWLSAPTRAAVVIALVLKLAALAPLAAAFLRFEILHARTGGITKQAEEQQKYALDSAFRAELARRRWPMTKLMADLSASLPVGVEVQSLRLEVGERVQLKGTAPSLDLVNQAQATLNQSGVFADASIDRSRFDEAKGVVEFELSARAVRPFQPAKQLDDFAARPLAERLYGSSARSIPASTSSASDNAAPTSEPSSASAAPETSSSTAPRASRRPSASDQPPAPISDEAIAALDATAAMKEWTTRQRASKQASLDQPTRDRLKAEADKCRARMAAARQEAPK